MKNEVIQFLSKINYVRKYFSGIGTIFMLHRVNNFEKNIIFPNENLKVSPQFLDKFIRNLKSNGFDIISIEQLCKKLLLKKKLKKQIVFTLDDGYLDNYVNAYPIFKKHNVPFTIYLSTGFIERNTNVWWHDIEDIISVNDNINFDDYIIKCKTSEEKLNAFFILRKKILNLDKKNYHDKMINFLNYYKIHSKKNTSKLFMNWENIIKLSNDNLVTIGSHTKNHYALNKLSEKEIIDEVIGANILIEKKINKKVNHFAFPYGTRNEVGKNEIEILKNLRFNSVVTTRNGNIYNDHVNYTSCLPRIMLTEEFKIDDLGKIRRKKVVTI